MKHDTLYSRDSSGRIRVWWMESCGHKYRTISGLQDGEHVTSEFTEVKGKNTGKKNESSPEQQALLEVEAKYKKQLKTGYFKDINDIENFQFVEPQLAKQYKDYADKIDFTKREYGIQKKLNGNRCVATRYGLFTRKGEKYISIPHIEEALKVYFTVNPEAVLDGEIYNYGLRQRLNELSSLVRKTKNITKEDLDKSASICEFWIYDGYGFLNLTESSPYNIRHTVLSSLNKDYEVLGFIKVLPYEVLSSQEQFNQLYNEFIEDGEEGAILRKLDSPYEHKRSKYLLKVKPEDDSEGVILEVHEGQGNWGGVAKTVTIDWNGKVFDGTIKADRETCLQFLKDKNKWIGKRVTFKYFGLTGLGIPNYCQLSPENCEPST